jgi:uncharacterized membrane protein YhaH (DUF805 family)
MFQMIKFICKECGQKYEIDYNTSFESFNCAQCGSIVQVPKSCNKSSFSVNVKLSLNQYFISTLGKWLIFQGRARRKEYWSFVLFSAIVSISLSILSTVSILLSREGTMSTYLAIGLFYFFEGWIWIAGWALTARRLHDIGFSAWWTLGTHFPILLNFFIYTNSHIFDYELIGVIDLLIGIVSIIALIPTICMVFMPSRTQGDRFGNNPISYSEINLSKSFYEKTSGRFKKCALLSLLILVISVCERGCSPDSEDSQNGSEIEEAATEEVDDTSYIENIAQRAIKYGSRDGKNVVFSIYQIVEEYEYFSVALCHEQRYDSYMGEYVDVGDVFALVYPSKGNRGIVEGDRIKEDYLYYSGTYKYTTVRNYTKKVNLYATDLEVSIEALKEQGFLD